MNVSVLLPAARRSGPSRARSALIAFVSAVLLFGTVSVSSPGDARGATSVRFALCSANLRNSASTTARVRRVVPARARVTVTTLVTGRSWRTRCAGRTVSGRTWLRISRINGRSVKSLYGVSYLYAAKSLFRSQPAPAAVPLIPTPAPVPMPGTPPVSGARALGVYVHDSAWNHSLLDAYAAQVGRKPSFAASYHEFTSSSSDGGERFPDFPNGPAPQVSELTAWAARGIVPILTWQPLRDYATGPDAAFTLATITAGKHDGEINAWATAAAAYGKPLYIRFAHEMNGNWYPWGQHINGNTPAQYVAAWRYVVNKFRAAGATNVKWIWSPNILYGNVWPITGLYPGDDYVDMIGMDGYNWGTSGKGPVGWFSFTTLFAGLYDQVHALAPSKPIYVAEVGSTESGGDKAAWIKSAFLSEIPNRFPAVRGVMWFDTTGGFDPNWSISTSPSALAAFRTVAASPAWQGSLP